MGNFFGKKSELGCATTTVHPIDRLAAALRVSAGRSWGDSVNSSVPFIVKTFEYVSIPDAAMEGYLLADVQGTLVSISWMSISPQRIRFTSVGRSPLSAGTELEWVNDTLLQFVTGSQKGALYKLI